MFNRFLKKVLFLAFCLTQFYSCGDTSVSEEGFKEAQISITSPEINTLYTVSATHAITIKNTGNKAATQLSFNFTEPNGYITYIGGLYPGIGGTCTTDLASGAECIIALSFLPLIPGDFTANAEMSFFNGATTKSTNIDFNLKGKRLNLFREAFLLHLFY